jgi:hypothetical protein
MTYRRNSLERDGLNKHLKRRGIDPAEFTLYVDRGAKPTRLLEIYEARVKNWRTIIKYLNQLARERGLEDYHDLYV